MFVLFFVKKKILHTRRREESAMKINDGNNNSCSPLGTKFSVPPSPSSAEDESVQDDATGGKDPSSTVASGPAALTVQPAEALTEASVPAVQVLSSREEKLGLCEGRVRVAEAVLGTKIEATASQPSPSTPGTEEASPSAGSGGLGVTPLPITPIQSSMRKGAIGPFSFPPEAPMYVLPLAGLSAAGCFPKYDAAIRSGALVPYDSLDRNITFVVFVSHRWVNEPTDPTGRAGFRRKQKGNGGNGTPDVDSAKHAFLVEGLNSILASLPREVAVFLWIDYSCIDQVRGGVLSAKNIPSLYVFR